MAKKKKMTKAQAAAARKEQTSQSRAKARSQEKLKEIRATQQHVKEERGKNSRAMLGVGALVVLIVIALAWLLTVGPGMLVGR